MERVIKKFKNFEEQENWQLQYSAKLTPIERLKRLRELQKNFNQFKPLLQNIERKIIKRNGFI